MRDRELELRYRNKTRMQFCEAAIPAVATSFIGGLGGGLAGARGTPDQVNIQDGNSSSSSQLTLNPMTPEQQQLQQSSLQNYLQQQALAGQYENQMGGAQNIQNQAQQAYGNVLNGQAFQISPQQQALIQQQRNLAVSQSTSDINNLLNQRLGDLSSQAAQQGLRGQAVSQLQGDTMRTAAQQYGNTVRGADLAAAGKSLDMPFQQVQAQTPFIQQGSNMANMMNLQAQQNRMSAQNPYLLQLLQNERLATGNQTTNESHYGVTNQKGQPGSFLGALQGFLGGAAGGANAGIQGYGAYQQGQNNQAQANYYASKTPSGGGGGG